jgi:tyrosine-protein kinase Etk/Wzc
MAENKKIGFLDFLVLIVTWKRVLLLIFFLSLATSYLCIRFLIPPQFCATATIIPAGETNALTGLTSLIKDFSVALPSGLGGISKESEMDLYNTILFSRSSIELLMQKFNLQKLYKIKSKEKAIKAIRKTITTSITLENAYIISARSNAPQLSADMANYLVTYLNEKIIELHVAKAKDNRSFLEQRYNEIKENVKKAEDSLQSFQEKTGIFEANEQTKATLDGFAKLESDLAVKQIEFSIFNKIYGENSPTAANAKISVQEYQNLIDRLKNGQDKSNILIGINSLPKKVMSYYKYFRDVKIYNQMIEFILPLYEQSKFDEQKTIPIIQIIDYAVPPEKKSFPPRTLMAIVISCIVLGVSVFIIIIKQLLSTVSNPKIVFIKKELFNFKNK